MIYSLRMGNPARSALKTMAAVGSVLIGLLGGCAGADLRTDYQLAHDRIDRYLSTNPQTDPAIAAAIRQGSVRKGMTQEQVIAAWGQPAVVQKFRGGALQLWYFGCDWPHICTDPEEWFPTPDQIYQSNALFENGKVIDFQE